MVERTGGERQSQTGRRPLASKSWQWQLMPSCCPTMLLAAPSNQSLLMYFPSTSDNGLQPGIGIMHWLHAAMWNQLHWNWLWEQNMVHCPSLRPMRILMSAVVLWCLLVGGCMQEKTHFFGSYFLQRLLPVLASAWLWWCAADCGRERIPSCSQILELQNWTMWSLASHAKQQREKSQRATSMPRRMPHKMQMFLKRSEGRSLSWMVKNSAKGAERQDSFLPNSLLRGVWGELYIAADIYEGVEHDNLFKGTSCGAIGFSKRVNLCRAHCRFKIQLSEKALSSRANGVAISIRIMLRVA